MYLLDTNICIDIMAGRNGVDERLARFDASLAYTSAVSVAELFYGALRSGRPEAEMVKVWLLLRDLLVIRLDVRAAAQYAVLKAQLAAQGELLEDNDLFIAATALSRGLTLVTHDKGFARVPNLQTEDWLA